MGIAEFNRFLQEKIRELGVPELEAVPAAALLEQSGLLRYSQHRSDRDVRKDLFFNRPRPIEDESSGIWSHPANR